MGEYLPEKFSLQYIKDKKNEVHELNEKDIEFDFRLDKNDYILQFSSSHSDLSLELPITYYSGYKAYIDDYELECYESDNGLLIVNTEGFNEGKVVVKYELTLAQKSGICISYISVIGLILIIRRRYAQKEYNKADEN
jgi:uncharacterized membrane protein YfhO